MDELSRRLDAATRRRNDLSAAVKKAEGRLEAAKNALAALEDECRSKGIDPNSIDSTIEKLSQKAHELLATLEANIKNAEQAIAPYKE